MTQEYNPTFNFNDSPTIVNFLHDTESPVRFLVGPVGSGKSVACAVEIGRIASEQLCYPGDTYRRSRFAIVRNTSPELKTTTIKTWLDIYPENACGPIRYSSPITHRIIVKPKGRPEDDGFIPGIDMELLFIPLDSPKDVKKLRSLELTAVWINEGSEVPKAIFDMCRRRIGRYPARLRGTEYMAQRHCVLSDLNAPDEDHWICKMESEPPAGWAFYHQPPAVFELEKHADHCTVIDAEARGNRVPLESCTQWLNRWWCVNPQAENLNNLIVGYYFTQIAGSNLDQIRRDLQARYHYVQDGKPVIPGFAREIYVVDELPLLKNIPLQAGMDIGGGTLNPAATLGQRHPRGPWLIHDELVCMDLGLDKFSELFRAKLTEQHLAGAELSVAWGDPAGEKRDELFETVIFDHLKARGIPARAAPTNAIGPRIEAIRSPMGRMFEGKPGLIIHQRAKLLIKALSGAWHFRRVQVSGDERFHDKPDKSHPYSDCGDALGYMLLGGGEFRRMTRGTTGHQMQGPVTMKTEFNLFDV